MVFKIGDLKLEGGFCWKLIHIETHPKKIKLCYREVVNEFLEANMVKVDGEWVKTSELFKPNEYPRTIKDQTVTLNVQRNEMDEGTKKF